ncbi:MAG: hypothetical protein AW11_00270 [Candidatus Accumulibacter regalis]|jgi:hypothetical protein|uniref:Uncharacterized protein n=1 Tax=Accumulibacter regalis TaxID=522306 RepID=A0A011RIA8_ACCRE|nr:hypothetical protein [Accumulibacter sp.]EXI90929.1 MAG: hypothetical protein AW11_00270 [Candidatus Accumulibacter regalis]MQM34560.1 hypothetical protein [Candidatus Accumulibacter phosphatis]MBN8513837.1 hypothetical protein [Accumulibacter sp.]MBO3703363.1 hypothetical protein [Accumulibacter sp.]HRE69526.1 hypothetical protein [Accumulibacter sp.]
MLVWLIILSGLLGVVAWFFWRARAQPAPMRDKPQADSQQPFHAVSIRRGKKACAAVRQIGGQRFLASDAPRLPLRGCDVDPCQCRYAHFDDRREDERRQIHALQRGFIDAVGNRERRVERERRRSVEFA